MGGDRNGPSVRELVKELVESVRPEERRRDVRSLTEAFEEMGEMDDVDLSAAAGQSISAWREARAVFLFQMALGWERLASEDPSGAFACFQEAAKRESQHPALVEALEIIRRKWGVA